MTFSRTTRDHLPANLDASPNAPGDPAWDMVVRVLQDDFACDADEIVPFANFFNDLGLESIDLLDFSFRAERELGVRSPITRLTKSDRWRMDEGGRMSADTAAWLATELATFGLEPPEMSRIVTYKDIVTVEFLAGAFRHALHERDRGTTPA